MRRTNCGIEKAEILRGNIGYLKLNLFPDLSVCKETAQRAMMRLNDVDSLIIDMRDNRGGFPNMVSFIAAYLFDHREYFYNPREDTTEHSWTQSPVAGSHLADKPVYLLTSARTISGAEQFSYNLKMLHRATIVGETTAGAAHAGTFYRLNEHFGIAIRHSKALNPYSKYGWEGTGVEPDIRASSANALAEALRQVHSQQERISRNRTQPTSASR
jgi:C-terminal processing protease CtpA/Prc